MNFLGHLYFSRNNPQLQIANLYGDFVKGKDLSEFPPIIQKGIRLHREIDSYIDNHPAVLDLLHELYEELPKISGIAIDLYFDHLLAKNWKVFHDTEYDEYLNEFYSVELLNEVYYSTEFLIVLAKIKQNNWMHYYQFFDGLEKACNGLSQRISFENALPHAPKVFKQKEAKIEETFYTYMKDAHQHFKAYFEENIPEYL